MQGSAHGKSFYTQPGTPSNEELLQSYETEALAKLWSLRPREHGKEHKIETPGIPQKNTWVRRDYLFSPQRTSFGKVIAEAVWIMTLEKNGQPYDVGFYLSEYFATELGQHWGVCATATTASRVIAKLGQFHIQEMRRVVDDGAIANRYDLLTTLTEFYQKRAALLLPLEATTENFRLTKEILAEIFAEYQLQLTALWGSQGTRHEQNKGYKEQLSDLRLDELVPKATEVIDAGIAKELARAEYLSKEIQQLFEDIAKAEKDETSANTEAAKVAAKKLKLSLIEKKYYLLRSIGNASLYAGFIPSQLRYAIEEELSALWQGITYSIKRELGYPLAANRDMDHINAALAVLRDIPTPPNHCVAPVDQANYGEHPQEMATLVFSHHATQIDLGDFLLALSFATRMNHLQGIQQRTSDRILSLTPPYDASTQRFLGPREITIREVTTTHYRTPVTDAAGDSVTTLKNLAMLVPAMLVDFCYGLYQSARGQTPLVSKWQAWRTPFHNYISEQDKSDVHEHWRQQLVPPPKPVGAYVWDLGKAAVGKGKEFVAALWGLKTLPKDMYRKTFDDAVDAEYKKHPKNFKADITLDNVIAVIDAEIKIIQEAKAKQLSELNKELDTRAIATVNVGRFLAPSPSQTATWKLGFLNAILAGVDDFTREAMLKTFTHHPLVGVGMLWVFLTMGATIVDPTRTQALPASYRETAIKLGQLWASSRGGQIFTGAVSGGGLAGLVLDVFLSGYSSWALAGVVSLASEPAKIVAYAAAALFAGWIAGRANIRIISDETGKYPITTEAFTAFKLMLIFYQLLQSENRLQDLRARSPQLHELRTQLGSLLKNQYPDRATRKNAVDRICGAIIAHSNLFSYFQTIIKQLNASNSKLLPFFQELAVTQYCQQHKATLPLLSPESKHRLALLIDRYLPPYHLRQAEGLKFLLYPRPHSVIEYNVRIVPEHLAELSILSWYLLTHCCRETRAPLAASLQRYLPLLGDFATQVVHVPAQLFGIFDLLIRQAILNPIADLLMNQVLARFQALSDSHSLTYYNYSWAAELADTYAKFKGWLRIIPDYMDAECSPPTDFQQSIVAAVATLLENIEARQRRAALPASSSGQSADDGRSKGKSETRRDRMARPAMDGDDDCKEVSVTVLSDTEAAAAAAAASKKAKAQQRTQPTTSDISPSSSTDPDRGSTDRLPNGNTRSSSDDLNPKTPQVRSQHTGSLSQLHKERSIGAGVPARGAAAGRTIVAVAPRQAPPPLSRAAASSQQLPAAAGNAGRLAQAYAANKHGSGRRVISIADDTEAAPASGEVQVDVNQLRAQKELAKIFQRSATTGPRVLRGNLPAGPLTSVPAPGRLPPSTSTRTITQPRPPARPKK
jgi:hypothetical protein